MEVSLGGIQSSNQFNSRFYLVSAVQILFAFLLIIMGYLHRLMLLLIFFSICTDIESNPGPYQSFNLKLAHLNVRSLNAVDKFGGIASIILNQECDIFGLSGTWLNDLFSIPGHYPPIRLDRSDGRRAGRLCLCSGGSRPVPPVPRHRSNCPKVESQLVYCSCIK